MERLEDLETCSYLALILGVALDHVTTSLGITRFNLLEANIIAKSLMDLGVWGYVDMVLCLLFIMFSYLSYRKILQKQSNLMFVFPLSSGFIRLILSIWNVSIF